MTTTPNPGSVAAVEAGCICPVMDNNRGKYPPRPAEPEHGIPEGWWIVVGCPLHGESNWKDKDDEDE